MQASVEDDWYNFHSFITSLIRNNLFSKVGNDDVVVLVRVLIYKNWVLC